MSLHEAVEIQQREADLKKSPWPRLIAPALYLCSMLVYLGSITNTISTRPQSREAYLLFLLIAAGGLYLVYHHHKNRRRIEILELELLKLKRRLSESES